MTTDLSLPHSYPPSQTALLLLDWHEAFVRRKDLDSAVVNAAVDTTASTAEWARAKGIHVIHALIDVDSVVVPTGKDSARLESVTKMMRDHDLAKEPPQLRSDGDEYFYRTLGFVSALKSPGLLERLHAEGIRSLVLTGLSTSGCVMRTTFAATDAEFVATVLTDACADPLPEVHNVAIKSVMPMRAHLMTSTEFKAQFS